MASKVKQKEVIINNNSLEPMKLESEGFCSECLYTWCSHRAKIAFCTMKSKGLFECKSCMLKLIAKK